MSKPKAGQQTLANLLSPIKIGPVELKNRIALAPMNETLSNGQGQASEQCLSYFAARAKGGTGLITTGAIMGTKLSSNFVWGRNLYCFNPGHIQSLALLTDRVHYFGSKIAAQMSIGFGRQGHSYDHEMLAPAATGGLPYEMSMDKQSDTLHTGLRKSERAREFLTGQMTREMTIAEIHHEQKEFANSCQLALIAGFDVIEIHAPHGYLEHQFLSPFTNKRTDMYGGEWRNRKRFLNEVMEQIRYACPGVAVGVRISAEEHFEGGLTREEMIDLALDLEARGADYISLSDGGGYEEACHLVAMADRVEHIPDCAAEFKKALKIPVIAASQHDPVKANTDIGAGKFDISALGRQLFIDPEYANKVESNRADEINRCRRCDICLTRCLAGTTPACPFNPWLGREYASDEFQIGAWQKHERIMPPSPPMPALERPWWKPELTLLEKNWRKFRGPGPR
ncbi:MAG: NADH:flavin oxidoreductase [Desulfuromonadaceae bacterium]|nr:NADH:flavin oxidoreductase [Desulfuromonadaceae bacterium]